VNLEYLVNATNNNGQIATMIDHVANETVNYHYDALARLSMASSAQWDLTYTYDGFGNRAVQTGTGTATSATFNYNAQNQITGTAGSSYDLKGNMTPAPGIGAVVHGRAIGEGAALF
jgi:YD repeat-containing protein